MKITKAFLADKGAASDMIDMAAREWPDGGEVTIENVRRAIEMGLDVDWAATNLLSAAAQKTYFDAFTAARNAYLDAIAAARKVYFDAIAPAQESYNDATAAAFVSAWLTDHPAEEPAAVA